MQRTIRALRVALPIAFVAFIALLVFSWDRSAGRREREAGEPVTSTQRPEDRAQAEAKAFEDVQTIGGRVVSRIRASRVVAFESGWTTLEGVAITIYRQNGLTYEILCPEAQFNSTTKAAEAKGGVRLTSSDGIEILTAEIRFDGKRISNEIPVQFRVDRWTGNAGALDLDVETEALRLHRNVVATMAPPRPGEAPLTLRGAESMFLRAENRVEFRQGVEMDRGIDALSADWMMGLLSPDRRQLVALEGNGNCVIVTAARSMGAQGPGGRARITSENFRTEIGPEGRINAINASGGEGLARAVIDGPPVRDIVAKTFRVALTNQVVSEIKADWQVVMKEIETKREIRSEHVTVWFDPATRKARSAYLEGAFRYSDSRTTATAFRANYDIAGDRIVLTTDPGWQATVVADGQVLKAKQIEFSPRAETARASGAVIAQLVSRGKAGGPTADATAIFPSRQPVFVNADELLMNQGTRTAHFSGNVRAWQERNTLLSNELQVQGNGEIVTARGGVRTVLYNSTAAGSSPAPVQSRSDQLVARRGERRIDLLGNVSVVDDTRRLDSEKATLFLDANQKVQRVEAETSVRIAETATGRKGTGEKAIYEVDRKMMFVSGKPATISDPSGSVSGQQISFDLNRNRVQVVSPEGGTKGTYKHEG